MFMAVRGKAGAESRARVSGKACRKHPRCLQRATLAGPDDGTATETRKPSNFLHAWKSP
jgi:hypothetical protein